MPWYKARIIRIYALLYGLIFSHECILRFLGHLELGRLEGVLSSPSRGPAAVS